MSPEQIQNYSLDGRSDVYGPGIVSFKALAKEPDDGYATAGELAQEVSKVASGRWYLRKIMGD